MRMRRSERERKREKGKQEIKKEARGS